ncbi:MAG: winged helix-turn-helix domain-containing protein [Bryobacterales bacterium]|nr:winged helix-turn-helix domain-containing protein [Bryobacterales bacterium]
MAPSIYTFGPFELDVEAYQLRRNGVPVRLEHRPMALLLCLLEQPGKLVTREDIVDRLWGRDVFVDVEAGIHTAIRKIRRALGDSPSQPAYLETVPGKGYRFAGDVKASPTAPPRTCVAVLPVTVLDSGPDSQYLADGITEEVIAALGQSAPGHIRVIGRTTMMRYRGAQSLSEIASEVRADFLVESSLRSDSDAIRLVARLLGARDQAQLWCGTFDGERRHSVFALQRQLSLAIAGQLQEQLLPGTETFSRRQPAHPEAYDLYLRGRYLWHQLSPDTTRRAIEHFQRAAALDPNYALPWAGIAVSIAASPITGDAPVLAALDPARHAAAQAARVGPGLAETHTAAGFVQFWLEWDLGAAEDSFRRAIRIDGSDALAHRTLAIVLAYQQRAAEAETAARTACELDPLNAANFALAAQVAFFARQWPRAAAVARRAVEIDPGHWVAHLQLAQAAERLGDYETALRALAGAEPFCGNNSKVAGLRGFIHAVTSESAKALEILDQLAARRASQRFVPPYSEALIWLGLRDFDQTFRCLEQALAVRDVHLNFLLADAKWDPVRSQPGFSDLLERCGFRR